MVNVAFVLAADLEYAYRSLADFPRIFDVWSNACRIALLLPYVISIIEVCHQIWYVIDFEDTLAVFLEFVARRFEPSFYSLFLSGLCVVKMMVFDRI